MNSLLRTCAEDLERRIDERFEQALMDEWLAFWERPSPTGYFRPTQRKANPPGVQWPEININDAVTDFDLMLLRQLKGVSDTLNGARGRLAVRCDYGTGIMPMVLGCGMFTMPRETNTLPAAIPLGSADAVRQVVERGVPDVRATEIGRKVFHCGERFTELFERYPRIGRWVDLYHPDLQGPVDVAEVVWGSDMFYGFYDQPELVRGLLELVTQLYEQFIGLWFELAPNRHDPYTSHWMDLQRGWLMLRDDSLMNLSPEMYVEFVRPYDQRLLSKYHGGAIHFCGRCDHYIQAMSEMSDLYAVQMSQPHLNDMEVVFRNTVDKGIRMLGLAQEAAEAALASGRPLHGLVHVR